MWISVANGTDWVGRDGKGVTANGYEDFFWGGDKNVLKSIVVTVAQH